MILIGFIAYRATKTSPTTSSAGAASAASSPRVGGRLGHERLAADGPARRDLRAGLSESWIAIGLIIGAWLNWLFVAGRLRVHTEHNHNALTLPDYFSHRFEDESRMLRIFSALVILVFFTIYCASGGWPARGCSSPPSACPTNTHCGSALRRPSLRVHRRLPAVSWTDTVQATLMIFALLITPVRHPRPR